MKYAVVFTVSGRTFARGVMVSLDAAGQPQ